VRDDIGWVGAIFAATYAALYTRFSSQWSYLAGLYNQLMATQIATPGLERPEDDTERARCVLYRTWKAAFIEDALDVHLALKPSFAMVIAGMVADPAIRLEFVTTAKDGAARMKRLEKGLRRVLGAPALPADETLLAQS
jgi:hypothetical protein